MAAESAYHSVKDLDERLLHAPLAELLQPLQLSSHVLLAELSYFSTTVAVKHAEDRDVGVVRDVDLGKVRILHGAAPPLHSPAPEAQAMAIPVENLLVSDGRRKIGSHDGKWLLKARFGALPTLKRPC